MFGSKTTRLMSDIDRALYKGRKVVAFKAKKDNRYTNFNVQIGKKPVYENLVTSIPNFVNITYEFVLWTNFIEQMNPLVESFMEYDKTYWGDKDTYRFICNLDSVSDASEMDARGERFIKSSFSRIL